VRKTSVAERKDTHLGGFGGGKVWFGFQQGMLSEGNHI